jgi:hypothetical protein
MANMSSNGAEMSEPPQNTSSDASLRHFREYVAAAIAVLVVLGTFGMLIAAFLYIGESDTFTRVKDLLLIANPILGVVIGYYFNKVSTEARAENAETTARAASASAQQAMNEAQQSAAARAAAEEKTQSVTSALGDVQVAAEQVLSQPPAPTGVLGAEESPAFDDGRAALRAALERARRVTGK